VSAGRLHGVRIVVANNFPGPGMGGGEVQLLPVLAAWVDAGADVVILAPAGVELAERARAAGAEVAPADFGLSRAAGAVRAIREAAEAVPADSCVVVGTGYLTNLLARRAARKLDGARCINIVGVMPGASAVDGGSALGVMLRAAADRATIADADAVVAVSSAVRDALVSGGVPQAVVRLIPNGIDMQALRERAAEPARFGALPRPLVACVARLEPVKGVDVLVRAAGLLSDATVGIVGSGSQEARLREIAVASGVADRVHFLGDGGAASLLAQADVVAVPSRTEGFGLVAAEASALGRPVVASRVGGLLDVVEDGVTGVLVEPEDPQALARAVSALLADPDRAAAVGEAGRERAESLFTSERMAAAYVDLVAEFTGGGAR